MKIEQTEKIFDVLKNTLQSIAECNLEGALELLKNNKSAILQLQKNGNKEIVDITDEMSTYNRMLENKIRSLPILMERLEKEMADFFSAIKEEEK